MKLRRVLNAALVVAVLADTLGMRKTRASGTRSSRSTAATMRELRAGGGAEHTARADLLWAGLLGANAALNRGWGLVPMAAWWAQPALVFAGDDTVPDDLPGYTATRPYRDVHDGIEAIRDTTASSARTDRAQEIARRRQEYAADIALGTERFFHPQRPDCPWCGSAELTVRLRTTDLLQHKPGTFTLARCADCGHTFQNPRLTEAGLEFYYRDFYDGLGEDWLAGLFDSEAAQYPVRVGSVSRFTTPSTWLDVGTGHAHFCAAAAGLLPGTSFDGLDLGAAVEKAVERGRLRKAYRGTFGDRAGELAGQYDVVSMFHYLEHTPDPHTELLAARTALRPGGHLIIDVPDPECRLAGPLGRWWMPWLQPQHLHLVTAGNLRARLTDLGFTVLAEEHSAAHTAVDLRGAVWLALDKTAPRGDEPWRWRPPTGTERARRAAVFALGTPALLAAVLADHAVRPLADRLGVTNAFRVVARLEPNGKPP